jgi:hypothetical protein
MKHLITNLIVPELNLTCLREMKQHFSDKVQHPRLLAAWRTLPHASSIFLTHTTYSMSFGVIQ